MKSCTLVVFVFATQMCSAQPMEIRCTRPFESMDPTYPSLVCKGNDLLERGSPRKALEAYEAASKLQFFESPNYLIYYRIAAAQCAAGKRGEAIETLSTFEEALDILTGVRRCPDGSKPLSASEALMCAESYGPDSYGEKKGLEERRAIAKTYRQRIASLRRRCGLPL